MLLNKIYHGSHIYHATRLEIPKPRSKSMRMKVLKKYALKTLSRVEKECRKREKKAKKQEKEQGKWI